MRHRRYFLIIGALLLASCGSTAGDPNPPLTTGEQTLPTVERTTSTTEASGRVESCADVSAPLHRGDPGYRAELDRDGDGVACEG
jgi:hypothetical protein